MFKTKFLFLLLCCAAFCFGANAQTMPYSSKRKLTLPVKDTVLITDGNIDDLSIAEAAPSDYIFLPQSGKLFWKNKPKTDSIHVRYRAWPVNLRKTYSRKSLALIDSEFVFSAQNSDKQKASSGVAYDQLEINGSYGRSLSLGNNQDVVSNANFNLQLNGYLPDSIKIEGALTDNTIPFQPEGNTANLQEFDQIFISLSKNRSSLLLGDYNLNNPDAYFLNYTKRVQGIYFQTGTKAGKRLVYKTGLSASVAKGEFARNIFSGQEGNQGPYRLTGNNGEQLFIILAGTEKVYVDNVLQERGENADYIVNYNTNEIRFMPRRPINQFSRIQVEFEYRTTNYLNTLLYNYHTLDVGPKLHFSMNVYSNTDAKNQGFRQDLNTDKKNFLASLGDSIQNALLPNIAPDTFSANKILYRIKDTLAAGVHYDSVYEFARDAADAVYNVSFTYVGAGKGDYALAGGNANGRVYQWVGKNGGDYSAVSLIITPKTAQIATLGMTYQIDSFKRLYIELAGSNRDPNTFSARDNNTHKGGAAKMTYDETRFWGARSASGIRKWTLSNQLQYEYVQDRFKAIAPYRSVEFGRDWSVPLAGKTPDENWTSYAGKLRHRNGFTADVLSSAYFRGSDYSGLKTGAGLNIANAKTNTGFFASVMNASDAARTYRFAKPNAFAEVNFRRFIKSTLGAAYAVEQNTVRLKNADTLSAESFWFDIASLYWRSLQAKKFNYGINYFRRTDRVPAGTKWAEQNHSDNLNANTDISISNSNHITATLAYRKLTPEGTQLLSQKKEETFLGRIQYDGSIWKRVFTFNTLYEAGSGQEQKRNFTYVQVPAGQGIFNWIDYNGDGLQQLNEFVEGLYPDQKIYIRIYTPSDEYAKVSNTLINQNITFEPSNFGLKRKGFSAVLARIVSNQFSVQTNNKFLSGSGGKTFSPIADGIPDSAVMAASVVLNNTLFLNRTGSAWGLDYNYLKNTNRQLLTYGLAENANEQHLAKARTALSKKFTFTLTGRKGFRSNYSGIADGSAYLQQYISAEPGISFLDAARLRINLSAKAESRKNAEVLGGEKADMRALIVEARYSQASSGALQIRFTYNSIQYNGLASAPVSYVMLDGLKNGNNFLWFANWQRRLGKGIELFIEYEGRKAATDAVIHTGRMSIRAIL